MALLLLVDETGESIVQFPLLFHCLSKSLREFEEDQTNVARRLQALFVGLIVQTLTESAVQERERVVSFNVQGRRDGGLYTIHCLAELILVLRYLQHSDRGGRSAEVVGN